MVRIPTGAAQAAATALVVPQAVGGWALVLRYGSAIGPCDDRTALPDDMLASIGAGEELQPTIAAHSRPS